MSVCNGVDNVPRYAFVECHMRGFYLFIRAIRDIPCDAAPVRKYVPRRVLEVLINLI